nr:plasmid pRiA4b ORF-3 family protein [Opitutus sp. ER46]
MRLRDTDVARTVLVPGAIKLPKLHRVIQAAMGWRNCHLHMFRSKLGNFAPPAPEGEEASGCLDETRMPLDALIEGEGDQLTYVYDFGEYWVHELRVDRITAPPDRRQRAECVDGKMACPPEDVGGIPGYQTLCAAMTKSNSAEYRQFVEWLGGPFAPEAFDLERARAQLARIAV